MSESAKADTRHSDLGVLYRSAIMIDDFHYAQKGRSILGLFSAAVMTTLTIGFYLSGNLLFQFISFGLLILLISAIYAILKGEEWLLGVSDNNFYWSYPRWPKSSGTINLEGVKKVVIDDASGWILFYLDSGSLQRIRLAGGAYKLNEFLRSRFPALNVDYIENS